VSTLHALTSQLSILTKDIRVVKLAPNWAQQIYLDTAEEQLRTTGRIRIITLKARQIGISTITEALMFTMAFMYENYKGVVMAHEVPASQNLLGMFSRYWDTYPARHLYHTKYAGKNELAWRETGSSLRVATAGGKNPVRSSTLSALHASEMAFWEPDPYETWLGVAQAVPAVPGTFIAIESTANGIGNLYESFWNDANSGENEYWPLFFPWHHHPEYLASYINLDYHALGNLDDEEKVLRGMGISDDRLAWRRWAIPNLCGNSLLKFHQEYPTTPEEAFISTGTNIFPVQELSAVYEPEEGYRGFLERDGNNAYFIPSSEGDFTVYRAPSRDEEYGIYMSGGDPTRTYGGDKCCIQVLNRHTMEQVAVWHGHTIPSRFAEDMFKIGLYYNTCMLAPEVQGSGYSVIGFLQAMNYPSIYHRQRPDTTPGKENDIYGWQTTRQSKNLCIGVLLKAVVEGAQMKRRGERNYFCIHHRDTYTQMKNYVAYDDGDMGPADKENGSDDCVMAMAITTVTHFQEPPPPPPGSGWLEPVPAGYEGGPQHVQPLTGVLPWEQWHGT
jgi:hypothetical protein